MFGRSFLPDREKAEAAHGFAYANRGIIHAAFDAGELKQVILDRLGKMFVAEGPVDG